MMSEEKSPAIESNQDATILWGMPLHITGCSVCEHAFLVPDLSLDILCPNCAQSKLTPQTAELRSEPPEMAVPFTIQPGQVSSKLNEFIQKPWLKPDDFTHENLVSRLQKVFMPMWLVDCQVSGSWQGEAGFNYQVRTSQEFFKNGSWQSREVTKTQVRWEPRLGFLSRMYYNVSTPAFNGYAQFIGKIGKFRLNQAVPYLKESLLDAIIRIPDLSPDNAWPIAQDNLKQVALNECQQAVAADYLRNFSIAADFNNPHWTQLLLPIYFTWYRTDDGTNIPVFMHGQTGDILGVRLASRQKGWKIAGVSVAMAVLFFFLTLIFAATAAILPILSILALLFGIAAFFAFVFALVPAVYPRHWNRTQLSEMVSLPPNSQKPKS